MSRREFFRISVGTVARPFVVHKNNGGCRVHGLIGEEYASDLFFARVAGIPKIRREDPEQRNWAESIPAE